MLTPLPSYGRGRDAAAGRYQSLIFGTNLTDVIVTGKSRLLNFSFNFLSFALRLALYNLQICSSRSLCARGQWDYRWSRRFLVAEVPRRQAEVHPPLPDRVHVHRYHPDLKPDPPQFPILECSPCL